MGSWVAQLVEVLVGKPDSVSPLTFGHACESFEIERGEERWILKTSRAPGAFDHSRKHFEVLRRLGVPTPQDVRQGSADGVDYLLYPKIPGRDLRYELPSMNPDQVRRLAEQMVTIQRAVATLGPGAGFGWTPMGVPGPFANWFEVVERDSANAPSEVRSEIARIEPYLRNHPATCFLDDITMKNVIVDKGELQGIVDLDFLCYGDPMYMLALAETTAMLDIGFEALSYGAELRRAWKLTPDQERACAVYGAVHGSAFVRRAIASDEWLPRMREWVDRCLGACRVLEQEPADRPSGPRP